MWKNANSERTDEVFVVDITSKHIRFGRGLLLDGKETVPLLFLNCFFAGMFCVLVKKERKSLTLTRTWRSWPQECGTLIQPNSLVLHGGLNKMARVKCSSGTGFFKLCIRITHVKDVQREGKN